MGKRTNFFHQKFIKSTCEWKFHLLTMTTSREQVVNGKKRHGDVKLNELDSGLGERTKEKFSEADVFLRLLTMFCT